MDLESVFRDLIRPELNNIYTEPPSQRGGGEDMGFFCREHAYHCYLLCKMLGYDAAIKRGDLTFSFDTSFTWTSFDSGTDHAWCQVSDVVPIDLSVNFQFYKKQYPNIDVIYGPGQRGAYSVSYSADATDYEQHVYDRPAHPRISYLEREAVDIPIGDLLDDPHRFLIKPPGAGGMVALFGNHIFSGISLHLFHLANGTTKPLTTYKDSRNTVRTIATRYPAAITDVKHLVFERT